MKPETTTTDATALFRAFVACLIVASLPIKNAAYVTPALYLLILWLHGEFRIVGRVVMLTSAILLISSIAVLWDHLAGRTVNFPGLWFGLITYGPLFVVLCETFDRPIDQREFDRFATVCIWFILIQSSIGLLQFAATRNTDAVCGTFGLFDGFRPSITIAQVYFTFTILGLILFIIPVAGERLPRLAIAMGVLTCVIAQSGHQLIFFIVALVICGLARLSHLGTLVKAVGAAAVMTWLILAISPDTVSLATGWYGKVFDASDSPKRLAYEGAVSILDDPKNLIIGTGLGQYSSRAALISSDEYLNVKLPDFLIGKSDYFDDHIDPAIVLFEKTGEGSAISKPYMTAISLPVEFGLLFTIALLAVIGHCIVWCARVMMANSDQVRWIGFTMIVGILFFVLCCFIENYAEFSQAVFVPFILFVVSGSRAQSVLGAFEAPDRKPTPKMLHAFAPRRLPR
jgi:hypothetical protein